ncbi:MAG: hypothetical protein AAGI23_05445 [Bacteroidota bacterium]
MQTKINWKNHFVGFVLVVASILLAFQLERWGESKQEKELVELHLKEIIEETKFNEQQLEVVIEKMESDVLKIDTLFQLIDKGEDLVNINRLVFQLLDVRPPYVKKNAYNSFTTSGDIRFVEDFEQKSEIISLYEYHDQIEAFGELLLDSYEEGFWSYIREELDLRNARPQPIEVYTERSFINGVSSYRYFLYRCLATYRTHEQRMEDFLETFGTEA